MSSQQSRVQRLRRDLQRPGGGWTMGALTLLGMLAIRGLVLAGYWPLPRWTGTGVMLALLVVHLGWASNGYYPTL